MAKTLVSSLNWEVLNNIDCPSVTYELTDRTNVTMDSIFFVDNSNNILVNTTNSTKINNHTIRVLASVYSLMNYTEFSVVVENRTKNCLETNLTIPDLIDLLYNVGDTMIAYVMPEW